MGCYGASELWITVIVIVLVMAATRLPQLGDALGRSVRNFRRGLSGDNEIDVTPERLEAPEDAPSDPKDAPPSA